jgi:ABC-type multidrug transport system fused ATPase/permease subunit
MSTKMLQIIVPFLAAIRLSFGFCWRFARKETIGKLVGPIGKTVIGYASLLFIGAIVNAGQKVLSAGGVHTFAEFLASDLYLPTLGLVVVQLGQVVVGQLHSYYSEGWGLRLRHANRMDLNDHRATLDVARVQSEAYDNMNVRINELPQGWWTRVGFSGEVFNLLTTATSFVLFGASLVLFDYRYAVVLLVLSLPMVYADFKMSNRRWALSNELTPLNKKRVMLEAAYLRQTAFAQARMFNQFPSLKREISELVTTVINRTNELRRLGFVYETLTTLLAVVALCAVVVHAIVTTASSATGQFGTLLIVMNAAITFQRDLMELVSLSVQNWTSSRGVDLIENGFKKEMQPVLETLDPVTFVPSGPPLIEGKQVWFKYPGCEEYVLRDVNFAFHPGEIVVIIGESGSGKSTLAALVKRLYDPTKGLIVAGATDLRRILPEDWNNVVSFLPQEYAIFDRTVGAEIASSRLGEEIDMERVREASRIAYLDHVVINQPGGYSAQMGSEFGGIVFSGGQKQRVACARALYQGGPVLMYDEPDSGLDPDSSQQLMERLLRRESGKTKILVTHNPANGDVYADRVFVMKEGCLVEQGTPGELRALNGEYVRMLEKNRTRLGA